MNLFVKNYKVFDNTNSFQDLNHSELVDDDDDDDILDSELGLKSSKRDDQEDDDEDDESESELSLVEVEIPSMMGLHHPSRSNHLHASFSRLEVANPNKIVVVNPPVVVSSTLKTLPSKQQQQPSSESTSSGGGVKLEKRIRLNYGKQQSQQQQPNSSSNVNLLNFGTLC